MCHVMLLMPVLALPLFWVVPPQVAVPLYLAITGVSGLLYWRIMISQRRRPQTGAESLIGVEAEVVSRQSEAGQAQYLVRSGGELWSATSPDELRPGDTVSITAVVGIRLVVALGGHGNGETFSATSAGGRPPVK